MGATGSNELNALLKAKVVKIRAELDVNGSLPKIKAQIDIISEKVKNKPVKLQVKLDLSVKDLNKQLNALYTKMHESKTAKTPMKLQVQIDVAGSAKIIKKQLDDVYKTVQDFNKQYGQQIKHMQQVINNANGKGNTASKGNATPFGAVDPALYVKSLREAEAYMKTQFRGGLFTSTELKDANGNLNGFIGNLTRANGVVQKIHYQWNAQAKTFAPINQTTITETEKNVHKAHTLLQSLYADLAKLRDGAGKTNLESVYKDYEKRAGHMTLNMDNVMDLKRQIREEGVLQQQIKATNQEFIRQEDLIRKITMAMKSNWIKSGKDATAVDLRNQLKGLTTSVKSDGSQENLQRQSLALKQINDQISLQALKERELIKLQTTRMQMTERLSQIASKTRSDDATSQSLIRDTKTLIQNAKTSKEWLAVLQNINRLRRDNKADADVQKLLNLQTRVEEKLIRLRDLGKMTQSAFNKSIFQLYNSTDRNIADVSRQFEVVSRQVRKTEQDMKRVATASKEILAGGSSKAGYFKGVVKAGDINELQRYFAEMYKGKVQTVTTRETTDALGRAVTELKVKMAGTGKEVQTYTLQMERANGALRQTAQGMEYNANRNLGAFEQLRIAMSRVPVWMIAMTAFYGTINTIKKMTHEILELDKALTEISRVASANISVDSLFRDSVALSKELGNNVHSVLAGVGEMARTFGDFNERQLIAITRTATLMSNVSDLTAEEATQNLVGTMNAFNISAEESIHIVDALNEVDNNYAISTKQLAEGLSKASATAKTFGADMEDVVGNITAIGAVTMESGAIIGNSLKTIFSRITTVDSAKDAIRGVGVAINDLATGDVRRVEDILGDLGKRWNELNASQQQNLGIQIAGRYQLSRFLALMNNWQMSLDATNTATYSQGSAMRENAKYMQSFEARINQLKNGWTELSSAVGDSILSNGLLSIIELFKKLAEAGVWLADHIGALPVVFMTLIPILAKMGILESIFLSMMKFKAIGGIIGLWKTMTLTTKAFFTMYRTEVSATSGVAMTRTQALASAWRGVTVAEAGATAGMRGFALAVRSALITTGIGALIVAIGFGIEFLTKKMGENKRKAEELENMNKNMVKAYRSHRDGMDELVSRYDELSKKQVKSQDEQDELVKLQQTLAKEIPTTVAYIDANGKAHMKTTDAIRREIEEVKKLSKANADLETIKFNENLEKQSKSYDKINAKIKKLAEQRKTLEEANGQKYIVTDYATGDGKTTFETKDTSKAIQQNKVETLMAEAEKTEALKKTIKSIQAQSLAWLESNNMMANLSDAQQGAVEKFISQNEAILRNAKNFNKAYEGLFTMGNQIGTVFSDATDSYKKMLADSPDLNKAMNLDEFKKQMDAVAKSIPETFFQMTDASGRVVKSQDDIVNGLKEIVNVSAIAKTAGADQANDLIYRLQRTGLTAEEAQGYIWRLANENKNLALRTETAKQMTDQQVASLEDLNQEAMKAIDITAELFGFGSDQLQGITTRITAMHLLRHQMGENYKTDERYVAMQMEVADALGITTEELDKNWVKYYNLADGLSKIDWTKYTPDMDTKKFVESQKDLSPDLKKALLGWDGLKNIITGKVNETSKEIGDKAPEITQKVQNIFNDVKLEAPEVDFTRTRTNIFFVEDDIGKLQKKLSDLGITINTPTGNKMIDDLMGHLEMADGKVTDNNSNLLLLRGMIQAGIQTGFFDSIIAGADGTITKVDTAKGTLDTLKQTAQAPFNPNFQPLNDGLDSVIKKAGETGDSWSLNSQVFNKPIQVNTQPFTTVDGMIKTMADTADTTKGKVDGVVSASSGLSQSSNDLKIVIEQSKSAKGEIDNINESLNQVGEKFSTKNIKDELNSMNGKLLDSKDKVVSLMISFLNLNNNVVTGGIQDLTQQLGLLSGNLALATQYGQTTAQAQQAIIDAFGRVTSTAQAYNVALSNAGSNAGAYFEAMADAIDNAVARIMLIYLRNVNALQEMVQITDSELNQLLSGWDSKATQIEGRIDTMTNRMHQAFKKGIKDIVSTAGTLPSQIGKAVRDNMASATDAMDALAKDMVKRFKKELGIHSPSRVFTDLGGWVVKGLVNGLTGHDLSSLGKDVFNDFGGGIFDSWDMIKAYVSGDFSNIAGKAGSGVQQWSATAIKALQMTGQYSEANLQRLLYQMQTESGGNAGAINLWDSNAKKGIPSKGLMQVIDPTFKSYAMKGYDSNIYDPLSNILASIRYALSRYGSLANAYKGHGYANGGIIDEMELAWHGEEGAEAIIPLIAKRRNRGLQLWEEAGARLGIEPSAIAWIKQFIGKGGGGTASSSTGSFGASSGDGGGAVGGGDSGASGTITPSIQSIVGYNTLNGGYNMMALAKDYSNEDRIADPYKSNSFSIQQDDLKTRMQLLQTAMEAMDKTSIKYRNTLKQIIELQNANTKSMKDEQSSLEKRQSEITKSINSLPVLNKQNADQREQWNNLMQEFDQNIQRINQIKTEVASVGEEIRKQSIEIFTNFIDEIVNKYDIAINAIQSKIDNIDFKVSVLELTNPDDIRSALNEKIKKAEISQQKQATAYNKQNTFQDEYNRVSSLFGVDSEQAKKVKELLDSSVKEYQDATLSVLNAEKDIKDTRAKIADDGISVLKDYYKNMKDMATDAIAKEKESIKKSHEYKMSTYDAEIEKINSVYDAKSKSLDDEVAQEDYNSQLAEKNAKKAELVNKIALLSRDNSLEGKKKLADLQQQLVDANKDIEDTQKQHNRELAKQALEDQKKAELDRVNATKDADQKAYDDKVAQLDAESEMISKHYDDLINNDKMWGEARNEAIKGNFSTIQSELQSMSENVNLMNQGIFSNLTSSFATYSDEVKKQIAEANALIASNMNYNFKTPTESVGSASGANKYTNTNGNVDSSKGANPLVKNPSMYRVFNSDGTLTDTSIMTLLYSLVKNGGKVIDTPQNMPKGTSGKTRLISPQGQLIDTDNQSLISNLLSQNYVKMMKFDTGGYTGNWSGSGGKVAMLHKKELVLNEEQTSNILDTAKIIDRIKDFVPNIIRNNIADKISTAKSVVTNTTYGDINVTVEGGDKKKSTDIAKEILKGMKKKGR